MNRLLVILAATLPLLVGCASPPSAAPSVAVQPTTEVHWTAIEPVVAETIPLTLAAFDDEWIVAQSSPSPEACWSYPSDDESRHHWVRTDEGTALVYAASSTYWDEDVSPFETVQRFAAVWEQSDSLTTVFDDSADPQHEYTYGRQRAGLPGTDQLAMTGGFDGDAWTFEITVSCATPGFNDSPPD